MAVIDIGSNSVRLVVFDAQARAPIPMFNEKATCALGAGLGASGRLNPDGRQAADNAIDRFLGLARAMQVGRLDLLATAAVRDAADGADFVAAIEGRHDVRVQVLSGDEEGRLSAEGVLGATPDADGVVADLGGGSLELVRIGAASTEPVGVGPSRTLPLGVLRLAEAGPAGSKALRQQIDTELAALPWLREAEGRSLYAVGGAWRAVARICIEQIGYPLHVLDKFTLDSRAAVDLIGLIARMSPRQLAQVPGVSKKRLETLPLAAQLLHQLLAMTAVRRLVFSVYGMREGQFFRMLPPKVRGEDPLIGACVHFAQRAGRFPDQGHELMTWMDPLFPDEAADDRRFRLAACILSDNFWDEHPDYRAEQAFLRTLRLPLVGLEHGDRAALALAVFHRYQTEGAEDTVARTRALLDTRRTERAQVIGTALRLGHTISGGAPGLVSRTRLVPDQRTLRLEVPTLSGVYQAEAFRRRLDRLASLVGREPEIAEGR